ncbi:carboxymuconolactone decarboxylase family protein [Gordonia sp. (in: high G+C Gram-positive bacteria)]|uniref:carboxymuconolactone decarboxylase family protein n=1 Tax=Gordonia sp. (in: high G+C Gram-positive bacteria) TaxID=84139 RepID=UPI0039E60EB8
MTTPRIEPGGLRQLGLFNWAFSRAASKTQGVQDAHIFSTLGQSKGLFRGWLYYSARMMPFGKLSRKDTEMIIIRVAHLRSCDYEMDHHRKLGKRAGIDEAMIGRIIEGPDAGWGDRERSMLLAVDEMVGSRDISDQTWAALARHLDNAELISFVLLISQYDSLATTLGVLRVQRDV